MPAELSCWGKQEGLLLLSHHALALLTDGLMASVHPGEGQLSWEKKPQATGEDPWLSLALSRGGQGINEWGLALPGQRWPDKPLVPLGEHAWPGLQAKWPSSKEVQSDGSPREALEEASLGVDQSPAGPHPARAKPVIILQLL